MLSFPGVWRRYQGPVKKDGPKVDIEVYAFLTTTPNKLVATINHERMPVLLTREDEFDAWLNGAPHLAFALAREYPPDQMRIVQEGFKKLRHTRAQKNESRPIVKLATTELLDGARNQRECLASPAVERMGGAESRGDERSQIGELPRATKIESAAQTLDRAREISFAKIGAPETE